MKTQILLRLLSISVILSGSIETADAGRGGSCPWRRGWEQLYSVKLAVPSDSGIQVEVNMGNDDGGHGWGVLIRDAALEADSEIFCKPYNKIGGYGCALKSGVTHVAPFSPIYTAPNYYNFKGPASDPIANFSLDGLERGKTYNVYVISFGNCSAENILGRDYVTIEIP